MSPVLAARLAGPPSGALQGIAGSSAVTGDRGHFTRQCKLHSYPNLAGAQKSNAAPAAEGQG